MENETTGFNTGVYGASGWPKFTTPMVAGKNPGIINEFNTAFDGVISVLRKGAVNASPQYLQAFNALSVQLHAIGELCLDGKATI